MFTVHVISDLNLLYNEFTPESEYNIPDVDLVVLNGNIGVLPKRSQLYVEELCKKYPDTQFVFNYGFSEFYPNGIMPKVNEVINTTYEQRESLNENTPKNFTRLYRKNKLIKLRNGDIADVFCAFGFPYIYSFKGKWEDYIWYRNIIVKGIDDPRDPEITLPKGTTLCNHGSMPVWASQQWINEQNAIEFNLIRDWELNVREGSKILLTHINPIQDSRTTNQVVEFFNIHLHNGVWIGSNTYINNTLYLGARFYSNPGRGETARSLVITV